jgi:hypothetical protein
LTKVQLKLWGGILEYDDDDLPDDVRSFNVFGKSVILWLETAGALHRAAVSLMEEREKPKSRITRTINAPIALMLGGYALEALLKMVIINGHCNEHGFNLDSQDAKDFLPKTHNLRVLVEQAKLRVSKADRNVLTAISKFAVWAGRYPIPLMAIGYDGPAIFAYIAPGKRATEHPMWRKYAPLYLKLHRLAVRRIRQSQ